MSGNDTSITQRRRLETTGYIAEQGRTDSKAATTALTRDQAEIQRFNYIK